MKKHLETTETSVIALLRQIEEGKFNSNKSKAVWIAINRPPLTYPKLRDLAGIKMASATATISHLLDLGVVEPVGELVIEDYLMNKYQYVSDNQKRRMLAMERHRQKYEVWKERGNKEFLEYILTDKDRCFGGLFSQ